MGDEDASKSSGKPPQRRPKVIIRKCKKISTDSVSKSSDVTKKVNGELQAKKYKEDSDDEVQIIDATEQDSKSGTKGKKRKSLETISSEDDDCTIIDDPTVIVNNEKDKSEGKEGSSSKEFKGFKKRIIAQTEKLIEHGENSSTNDVLAQESDKTRPTKKNLKVSKGKKRVDFNRKSNNATDSEVNQPVSPESQAEYAQYLGLQPTMQFKCYRCGEKGFPSMLALNMHQRGCGVSQKSNFLTNLQQDTAAMTSSDPNMLTNFRITRKVYLCSACGTYYENWNLFLHMRDVHKKHICLYCLTMFTVANKLVEHLRITHSVQESSFESSEEFQNSYKGSCYLICSLCENMFSERDDYFQHQCLNRDPTAKCTLCGVKCGHYYTCPNSNIPRTPPVSQPSTVNKSQIPSLNKPVIKTKNSEAHWSNKKNQGCQSSDNDDDYDISHAASFCLVDIGDESAGKDKSRSEDSLIDISSDNDEVECLPNAPEASTNPPDALTNTPETPTDTLEASITSPKAPTDTLEASITTPKVPTDTSEASINPPEGTATGGEDNVPSEINQESSQQSDPVSDNSKLVSVGEEKKDNIITSDSQSNESLTNQSVTVMDPEIMSSENSSKDHNEEKTESEVGSNEKSVEESDKISDVASSTTEEDNESTLPAEEGSKDKLIGEETQVDEANSKEQSNTVETNLPEKAAESDDKMEIDESYKSDGDKSQSPLQTDKAADTGNSDSDGEPVTHLSISQDESESSSDSSSDEDDKNTTNEKSSVHDKDESDGESDNSDKSALVVDEKQKQQSGDSTRDLENSTNDAASGEESLVETKSNTSNEATKGLDEGSSAEKHEERNVSENESEDNLETEQQSTQQELGDGIHLASEDVPAMALTLEDKLDNTSPQAVIKECVRTSCLNCVYCSHAIKIAVNGKQLALHLLAEHRYKPIKNNETSQDVIRKLKNSLGELEKLFFNTDSYDSSDKTLNTTYDHSYECFQCRFVTTIHKELYNHKRKMHQKTVLLCVMCKSNFYSYSELLCHMCPGIYLSEDVNFRCCFCNLDMIPSAFRLMVHLRKSHHTCDICLEVAGDQQKLSTHMWKHKLNHLCYRCGIAYRNKPDITKHLFWKHGTESVLCKKCLQKKWPHVYHFCIPPTVFICEECNASFSKAVALKVHKRYHAGEFPYGCSKCEQKFVSKKLLAKHEDTHNQPPPSEKVANEIDTGNKHDQSSEEHINVESVDEPSGEGSLKENISISIENGDKSESHSDLKTKKKKKKDKERKGKPVVDVYDLPPLNLSSESDSSENETNEAVEQNQTDKTSEVDVKKLDTTNEKALLSSVENIEPSEENQVPAPVVDGVWDSFHTYKAELEKRESKDLSLPNILPSTSSADPNAENDKSQEPEMESWFLHDHCYCTIPGKQKPVEGDEEPTISEPAPAEELTEKTPEEVPAPRGHSSSIDHAYATPTNTVADGPNTNASAPSEQPSLKEESPSTPPAQTQPVSESQSSRKKKQKTPKKKKHSNSSTSSDSSSDSDSSDSCTCDTGCSCNSSSNSTSSSSSDSESSTSEGRRRAAARREKKKERLKHKHHKEVESVPDVTVASPTKEEPIVDVPLEPVELPVKESDLDTDESSTDEDFYDKCPQSHAKQVSENRNKLMLLASVAPVNNGNVSPPPPPPVEEKPSPPPPTTTAKRKIKTKRRRKSQQSKKSANKAPQLHQQIHSLVDFPTAASTPSHVMSNQQKIVTKISSPLRTPVGTFQSDATAGSGSENESARLSKRKRVRNKFYGYSSDEEEEKPSMKWRKVDTPQIQPSGLNFQPSFTERPQLTMPTVKKRKSSESSGADEDQVVKRDVSSNSSSSSSESENEVDIKDNIQKEQTEKSDNLYCYCQCPYDEVSEMIACDGQDCTIEWFHFECVGIMVPPKGKWYCPDCRKRRDLM